MTADFFSAALSGLASAFPDCVPVALDYLCHAVYTECVPTAITNASTNILSRTQLTPSASVNISVAPCPQLCETVNANCQVLKSVGFPDIAWYAQTF